MHEFNWVYVIVANDKLKKIRFTDYTTVPIRMTSPSTT